MAESRLKEYIDINPTVKLQKGEVYSSVEMEKITVGKKIADANSKAEYTGKSCSKFLPNDTLMARITPCLENGKIAKYDSDAAGFGSTEFFVLRAKKKKTTADYVYYLSQTHYVRQLAVNSMTGASGRQRADAKFIGNIKWDFPEVGIQSKVADILSAYDNLIENNNKRIKLLEQMAENLYKEWFVRFRFPGYEHVEFESGIPKGWEILRANQLFDITIGKTPDRKIFEYFSNIPECNYPWISISDMRSASTFVFKTKEYLTFNAVNTCNVKIIPKNTVLVSFKLTVGQVAITTSDMCTNEAIAHFTTDNATMREYIYLYLKKFQYSDLGNTSSIGTAVNSKIIKNMKIILPSSELLNRFHDYVYSIFEEIRLLNETSSNLTKQRDMLLPRLMSGKLEV